jgi:hypothetical protein
VCETKALVYNLAGIQQIATVATGANPAGAIAVDCSYSSDVLAVPSSKETGGVDLYHYLDYLVAFRTVQAFDRPVKAVKAIELSRSAALMAIACDVAHEIAIVSAVSGVRLRTLGFGKRERLVRLAFDEVGMHLIAQMEGKLVNLYQLPLLDERTPVKPAGTVRPDASYSGSKPFWAFFGSNLFELNIVTEDLVLCRLKFDSSLKGFKEGEKQNLKDLQPGSGPI